MAIRNPLSLRLFRCLVGCVSLIVMLSSTAPVLGNKPIPITDRLIESTIGTGTDIVLHIDGEGVRVAVIDSGIAVNHPAFAPASERIVDQYDFVDNDPDANDEINLHGTMVAGVIGANPDYGVSIYQGHAPLVGLMPYRVQPSLPGTFPAHFEEALERAWMQNAHVVNLSLSTAGGYIPIVGKLDDFVRNHGITVVVAAGNSAEPIHSFAEAKNVITVGAINTGNFGGGDFPDAGCFESNWPPGQVSCFSSFGPVDSDGDGLTRVKPDLVAPGMQIPVPTVASGPIYGYDRMPGTSLAAPAVTGIVANMLDHYGGFMVNSPETQKAILIATAIDVGGQDMRHLYGYGVPNAFNTVFQISNRSRLVAWEYTRYTTGPISQIDPPVFVFPVHANFEYIRAVVTWSDIGLSSELINVFTLKIYENVSCTGSPIISTNDYTFEKVHDNLLVIEILGEDFLVTSDTSWCASLTGNVMAIPQRVGLAFYSAAKPPLLTIQTTHDAVEPINPNTIQGFTIKTSITNSGVPAGGAYTSLFIPNDFYLIYASLITGDGREQIYITSQLRNITESTGTTYYLGLGQIPFEREVEWYILPPGDPSFPVGAYAFRTSAGFQWKGDDVSAENTSHITLCVNNEKNFGPCPHYYLPLINGGE